jgi:hypothetical protein
MGILDDAIREHLDLKRKHGARESEISEIEDEALGSGERPDPFAASELFGEVSSAGPSTQEAPERDLSPQTPPPNGVEEPSLAERPIEEPTAVVEPPAAPAESPREEQPEPSFPEPPPAEPVTPEPRSAPERPAESESLEELMAQEEEEEDQAGPLAGGADVAVPPPPPPEAEGARPEPPSPPPTAATEGQRGRALGRVDVPTQEHIPAREETGEEPAPPSEPEAPPSEPEAPAGERGAPAGERGAPAGEPEPAEQGGAQLYDFETDSDLLAEEGAGREAAPAPAEERDDFESLGPVDEPQESEEDLYPSEEEAYGEQRGGTTDFEESEAVEADLETEVRPVVPAEDDDDGYPPEGRPRDPDDEDEDDVLSESPDFLDQDTDESLWFEKGPPKDFDFEDDDD